jgi:hypothetical protein
MRISGRRVTIAYTANGGANVVSDPLQVHAEPAVLEQLNSLLQRARQGDESVLPELRHLLDRKPEIWRHYGDLALHAIRSWTSLIAGEDLTLKESIARKVEELGREIGGSEPTPLERLLIDRVMVTWLQLQHAEVAACQSLKSSPNLGDFWLKRQNSAHRRLLTSVGALAMLRRLLPCTQSNGQSRGEDPCVGRLNLADSMSDQTQFRPQLRIAGVSDGGG